MKKTLTLLALTTAALMPMMPLEAEGKLITVNGVEFVEEGNWSTATGWFDANKLWKQADDSYMCWAATSSNLIAWWQSQNPTWQEEGEPWGGDAVWNTYKTTFVNDSGIISKGVEWWFDGTGTGSTSAELQYRENHVSSGGYYKDHLYGGTVEMTATSNNIITLNCIAFNKATTLASTLVNYMEKGYAVGLNMVNGSQGHAVTLWGVEYNASQQTITKLYIADSDDNNHGIRTLDVGVRSYEGYQTFCQDRTNWVVESFVLLSPTITNDVARLNNYNAESGEVTLRQKPGDSGYLLPDDTTSFNKVVYDNSRNSEAQYTVNRQLTVDKAHDGAHIGTVQVDATQGLNLLEVQKGVELTVENIAGSGMLTKTGEGTLKISQDANTTINVKAGVVEVAGDASSFTAAVTVDGGTLLSKNGAVGDITLNNGGTLHGSGKYKNVTVNGGTLSVGNSPGQQRITGTLTLSHANLEFYVAGWEEAATLNDASWDSGTYSNIDMGYGKKFSMQDSDGIDSINIFVGGDALAALSTTATFNLGLIVDFWNMDFDVSYLDSMLDKTHFFVASEEDALTNTTWQAGQELTEYIDFYYNFKDGSRMYDSSSIQLVGTFKGVVAPTPEPTTSTLSLLALASLCARRRRK